MLYPTEMHLILAEIARDWLSTEPEELERVDEIEIIQNPLDVLSGLGMYSQEIKELKEIAQIPEERAAFSAIYQIYHQKTTNRPKQKYFH